LVKTLELEGFKDSHLENNGTQLKESCAQIKLMDIHTQRCAKLSHLLSIRCERHEPITA